MKQRCLISSEEFDISGEEIEFYQRMGAEPPKLSPLERQRRRMMFRNFRSLYHRNCSVTGKRMLSMYSENVPFPVVTPEYWWSDSWDARQYGREIDFSRPFFEQYSELMRAVPRYAIMNLNSENCQFSNFTFEAKNCYLVFGCVRDEDCLYGHIVWDSKNCVDCLYAYKSEWSSNSIDIVGCYDVHYSLEASNCRESYFLFDCFGCQNCFCCYNLRQSQYCIFNQQYSREEYASKMKELLPLSAADVRKYSKWLSEMRLSKAVCPPRFELRNEDVDGNHLYDSKELAFCFDVKASENSKYCFTVHGTSNSYDISFSSGNVQHCLDSLTLANCQEVLWSHQLANCSNAAYSEICFSSNNIFGCTGLRKAEYCIFNKQYSKDEYNALRAKLVTHMRTTGEWGQFFPPHLSPFAYNEAISNEYMPLSHEEAEKRGLRWKEETPITQGNATLSPPVTIAAVSDDVVSKVFTCAESGKSYRIISAELDFHRRMNLPLPQVCPDVRHAQRMNSRAARRLVGVRCSSCKEQFRSAHSPDWTERVLCEKCYANAVHS